MEAPEDLSSGRLYYTIAMPGFLLETGQVELQPGYTELVYDPVKLSQTFPNIDTECSRTDCFRNLEDSGLVDTVWVNVLLEAENGKFYGGQFTLQGPDLYVAK
jgi:hypothetical protein